MKSEILIDVGHKETRVALLEDKELVEIFIERAFNDRLVGNIYRGRVCSVLPGMQAAFIDIGYERNAFLYISDALPPNGGNGKSKKVKRNTIKDILKAGQEITVQVTKESIGSKGARLTTHLTLPGRYIVLLPNANYIGVSRRIEDENERNRLKSIIGKIKPKDMGIIVRTAAEGKKESEFLNDLNFLKKLWYTVSHRQKKGHVPRCIYTDLDLVQRTVRDMFTAEIDKLIINDTEQYKKVIELLNITSPGLKKKVKYFNKNYALFEYYGIESGILRALSRKVWLKCGGYLVVESTEALTVIDVNTGKYVGSKNLEETVVKTNVEAAREIAGQLRLRDIGGIIIIDFIDMYKYEHQQMVINELRKSLKKDRTKSTVVGLTGLGLVEMTRKKVRPRLSSMMYSDCPHCNGRGKVMSPESVARSAEKKICKYANDSSSNTIEINVHPEVARALKGNDGKNIRNLEKEYKKKIIIRTMENVDYEEIEIREIDTNPLVC